MLCDVDVVVDHKKRVSWVPVSMHTCGPVSVIVELLLVALRAARAPLKPNQNQIKLILKSNVKMSIFKPLA